MYFLQIQKMEKNLEMKYGITSKRKVNKKNEVQQRL
jgi:hypothetical protein